MRSADAVFTPGGTILFKPGVGLLASLVLAVWSNTALAQRPLGLDVSYWQGVISQNGWNTVHAAGWDFVFVRAVHYSAPGETSAHGSPDPYFVNNITQARAAGMIAGAYAYARNSIRDPITEADFFLAYAAPYITPGYMRPALDLEDGISAVGAANLSAWAVAWCNRVEQQTGVRPLIYCNSNYARNYLNSSVTVYPLWVANWTYPSNPRTANPPSNADGVWPTWTFWQYSNQGNGTDVSVPGINARVDLNVFNGTAAQLQTYVITNPNVPPVISAVQASGITNTSATITWTTDTPSSTQVQYGPTASYGSASPLNSSPVTAHSVVLSGLSPNTLYHYRAVSTNDYGTTYSADHTFTTLGPPAITNVAAVNIGAGGATITWNTSAAANSQVRYGLTAGYGSQTAVSPANVTSHAVALTGLSPSTLYHYQAVSTNAYGTAQSADFTFTTGGLPVISSVAASNIAATAATISWTTSVPANSQVEYGLTTSYGLVTGLQAGEVTSHNVALSGLSPTTRYYYRVRSANAAGVAYSGNYTFQTTAILDPQTIIIEARSGGQNLSWYSEQGGFADSSATSAAPGCTSGIGSRYGSTYRSAAGLKIASFAPVFSSSSQWLVSVSWGSGANRRSPVLYRVIHAGGTAEIDIDQTQAPGVWYDLGTFTFDAGNAGRVEMSNEHIDVSGSMYASAVRFVQAASCPILYRDADGDGYGDPADSVVDCGAPAGYVSDDTDCDDGEFYVNPGATEVCNGVDDDCDDAIDEGFAPVGITQQPTDAAALVGETAVFTVAATGSGRSYQWQVSVGGGAFANVTNGSGGGTSSYTTVALTLAHDGNRYRCVVSGDCGQALSASAGLSVSDLQGPPVVIAARSRKPHGQAGTFDTNVAPTTAVEGRLGGPTQVVVTFDGPITGAGGLDPSDVIVTSGLVTGLHIAGNDLTVTLLGATDGFKLTMFFPGIVTPGSGVGSDSSLCFGVLVGDTDGDGVTSILDLVAIRNSMNAVPNSGSFRRDVNADGMISILDLVAVRNNLNRSLGGSCL